MSLPNVNAWVAAEEKQKQCLIKLYDQNIRAFKLNDVVTFIGVLEFNTEEEVKEVDAEGNSHMAAVEDDPLMHTGIPNEQYLPHLHALTFRRNHSLNTNSVLRKSQANEAMVKSEQALMAEAGEKVKAVLKMIMGGDALAAEYMLLCLLSRVHTRKDSLILGNLSVNLCNMSFI